MSDALLFAQAVVKVITSVRMDLSNEKSTQGAIEFAFTAKGLPFRRGSDAMRSTIDLQPHEISGHSGRDREGAASHVRSSDGVISNAGDLVAPSTPATPAGDW